MKTVALQRELPQTLPAAVVRVEIPNALPVLDSIVFWQDNVNYPALPNVGFRLRSRGVQVFPVAGMGLIDASYDNFCPVPLDHIGQVFDLGIILNGPPYNISVEFYNSQAEVAYPSLILGFREKDKPVAEVTRVDKVSESHEL